MTFCHASLKRNEVIDENDRCINLSNAGLLIELSQKIKKLEIIDDISKKGCEK